MSTGLSCLQDTIIAQVYRVVPVAPTAGTVSFSLILVPGCHRHRPCGGRFRARAPSHAAGHQAHAVEGADFGLQPPPPAVAPGPGVAGLAARTRSRWGQGILVEAPDVPAHGARLPVQARFLQGRAVDGVVVGRQPPRPALFQDREPAVPVGAGATQVQVQAFALGAQDLGNRCCARTGWPPVPERSAGAGGRLPRVAGTRRGRGRPCTANAGRAGDRARPGGGDGCHCAARRRPRNGGRAAGESGRAPLAFGMGRGWD